MDANKKQQRLQNRLEPEIAEFREQCKTLQLATVDDNGLPNISYSPFTYNESGYFVLISEIAKHARNLKSNPNVSMMMIEDEMNSKQLYARKRLSFSAQAELVERDTELWSSIVDQLSLRFGNIISKLQMMADFKLYQLVPKQGLYVKGFGQAYQVSHEDLVELVHLDEGHKAITPIPELEALQNSQ